MRLPIHAGLTLSLGLTALMLWPQAPIARAETAPAPVAARAAPAQGTAMTIDSSTDVVSGRLAPGDASTDPFNPNDTRIVDLYDFAGARGETITLYVNAYDPDQLDPLLGIAHRGGSWRQRDDNGGAGTNACLKLRLPSDGTYRIWVTSARPRPTQYGRYHLGIDRSGGPCPTGGPPPPSGGGPATAPPATPTTPPGRTAPTYRWSAPSRADGEWISLHVGFCSNGANTCAYLDYDLAAPRRVEFRYREWDGSQSPLQSMTLDGNGDRKWLRSSIIGYRCFEVRVLDGVTADSREILSDRTCQDDR